MSDEGLVEVYRAASSVQAQLMVSELEDAGIKAIIDGEMLEGVVGAIPAGWPSAPRIMVHPSDSGRARAILERLESRRPAAR